MKGLWLVAFLVCGSQVQAQAAGETKTSVPEAATEVRKDSGFHLTPYLGLGTTKITTSAGDLEGSSGVSTGGFAEFGSGYMSYQTGLALTMVSGKQTASSVESTLKLNYITIPVLAKVNIMGSTRRTVYIKAGLMPGFLVSKEIETKTFGLSRTTSNFSAGTFDLPAIVGVGGAIPVYSKGSIIVELNYSKSLNSYKLISDQINARNEGLALVVGMSFAL